MKSSSQQGSRSEIEEAARNSLYQGKSSARFNIGLLLFVTFFSLAVDFSPEESELRAEAGSSESQPATEPTAAAESQPATDQAPAAETKATPDSVSPATTEPAATTPAAAQPGVSPQSKSEPVVAKESDPTDQATQAPPAQLKVKSSHQSAEASPYQSIVLIRVVKNRYSLQEPYRSPTIQTEYGVGVALSSTEILTDLDGVRDLVSAKISQPGSSAEYNVRLKYIGYDCGLAILEISDSSYQGGVVPLSLTDEKTSNFEELQILGLKRSKTVISLNRAVQSVSREKLDGSDIDFRRLIKFHDRIPGSDIVINGAPVIKGGKLAGIFHQGERSYAISIQVIRHMLKDIADGKYEGFPLLEFYYDLVNNSHYRRQLGIRQNEGSLHIRRTFGAIRKNRLLFPGDTIIAVNGKSIDERGEIRIGNRQIHFDEYVGSLQAGMIPLKINRNGEILSLKIPTAPLSYSQRYRRPVFANQNYFLSAGLIFQEAGYDLVNSSAFKSNNLVRYSYENYYEDQLNEIMDYEVVLTAVLGDQINDNASSYVAGVVEYINNRRVRNLNDFKKEWQAAQDYFIVIKFRGDLPPFVIIRSEIDAANERIVQKYRLTEKSDAR